MSGPVESSAMPIPGRANAQADRSGRLAGVLRAGVAVPLLAALSTAIWAVLVGWYSLAGNRDNVHFAFEKLPGHSDSPVLRATLALFLLLALAYAAAWWTLAREPSLSRAAKAGAVAFVAGPGLANVLLYPVGALDAFNYLVELKLTYHYGQNPYLVTFAAHRADPFALPAFLVDVPLFYGPGWLLASGLPGLVAGYADPIGLLLALKVFHLALLGLTALVLFRAAGGGKPGWLAAFLFAANPLVLFEGVGNAHNDLLVALLLAAALVALRARSILAGPFLALSVAVKFFTAALAPLFLAAAAHGCWGWRRTATTMALAVAATVAVAAPFWEGGAMVGGLRRGTTLSQEMRHVSPLSLAKQVATARRATLPRGFPPLLPGSACTQPAGIAATGALSWWGLRACPGRWPTTRGFHQFVERAGLALFAILALLVARTVWRGRSPELAAAETMMLFALLATNLYPWYLLPIAVALALAPGRRARTWLFAATALGLAYYPAYVFARFDAGWDELGRHLFLALFLTVPMLVFLGANALDALRGSQRRPVPRPGLVPGEVVSAAPAD